MHVKKVSRVTLVLQGIDKTYFVLPRHWCELHDTLFAVCECGVDTQLFGSERYPLIVIVD